MTQTVRRRYWIEAFLKEQPQYSKLKIPASAQEQKTLLRSFLFKKKTSNIVSMDIVTANFREFHQNNHSVL